MARRRPSLQGLDPNDVDNPELEEILCAMNSMDPFVAHDENDEDRDSSHGSDGQQRRVHSDVEEIFLPSENSQPILDLDTFKNVNITMIGATAEPILSLKAFRELPEAFNIHLQHMCNITEPVSSQKYAWPELIKGRNVTIIGPPRTGKSTAYTIPLLASLIKARQLANGNERQNYLLIICPDRAVVDKTFAMIDNYTPLEYKTTKRDRGIRLLRLIRSDGNSEFAKEVKKRLKSGDYDVIIGTPCPVLTALESGRLDLSRCLRLVMEDADISLLLHMDQIKKIFLGYVKATDIKLKETRKFAKKHGVKGIDDGLVQTLSSVKLVIIGEKFSKEIQSLHESSLPIKRSVMIITDCLETAIYGKVEFRTFFTETAKEQVKSLIEAFNFASSVVDDKIIVCCKNRDEMKFVEMALKGVASRVVLAPTEFFDYNNLRNKLLEKGPCFNGLPNVLIVDDDNIYTLLSHAGINDAKCLIHFSLTDVKGVFSKRFNLMSRVIKEQKVSKLSILLLNSGHGQQAHELVDLMERLNEAGLNVKVDPKLIALRDKNPRGLCTNLASIGFCPLKKYFCFTDHFVSNSDCSKVHQLPIDVPTKGQIKFVVRAVLSVTEMYINIESHREAITPSAEWKSVGLSGERLQSLLDTLDGNPSTTKPINVGDIFAAWDVKYQAVQRVRILSFDHADCDAAYEKRTRKYWWSFHLDSGRLTSIEEAYLIDLPEPLKEIPPLAVKAYIVGLKPTENAIAWSPEDNSLVRELLESKPDILHMTAGIYCSASGCLWLDGVRIHRKLSQLGSETASRYIDHFIHTNNVAVKTEKVVIPGVPINDTSDLKILDAMDFQKKKTQWAFLPDGEVVEVYFSCCKNIDNVYVRLEKNQKLLMDLEKDIRNSNLKPLHSLWEGLLCVYQHDETSFNRAKILKVTKDRVHILCVDHGDEFTTEVANLFLLDPVFLTRLPLQIIHCQLDGVIGNVDREDIYDITWNNDNTYKILLCRRLGAVDLNGKRVGDEKTYIVSLHVQTSEESEHFTYTSLSRLLVDKGFAVKAEPSKEIEDTMTVKKEIFVKEEEETLCGDEVVVEELTPDERIARDNFLSVLNGRMEDVISSLSPTVSSTGIVSRKGGSHVIDNDDQDDDNNESSSNLNIDLSSFPQPSLDEVAPVDPDDEVDDKAEESDDDLDLENQRLNPLDGF